MPTSPPRPISLLRRARQARGWSQRQVAEAVGTNHFTVTRWEQGRAFPSPHFRQQLSLLFAQSPEALGLVSPRPLSASSSLLSQADPSLSGSAGVARDPLLLQPLVPAAELIGREGLLATLKRRLAAAPPFLAMRGLPGVGKTALALCLAHDPALRDLFPDGVLWASLGPHPPLLAHLQRWGRALGWSTEDLAPLQDLAVLGKALQTTIGQRRLLVVLDDIWEVDDALALKIGGPRCTHLATTRLQLIAHQLADERTLAIPELDDDDSLTLLQRLAPAATAAYPDDIHSFIRQVGGLPLALQLIGHALRVQELSGQPRRIERAIQALQHAEARLTLAEASAPTDTPPALQAGTPLSLEAVINVSVQALTASAQALLQVLAVFPAKPISFAEEAALGVSGLVQQEFLDGLDALLDAGLVESVGPARYTMHLTIADFARLTHPNLQQSQERYVRYYAALAQACRDDYPRLEEAFQHIIAAFQLAYDLQLWDALIPAVVAFAPFGQLRGFYPLLETHLKQALSGAKQLQDEQSCCHVLNALGTIAERQGAYAASQAYAEQALTLARKVESRYAMGKALHLLGVVYRHTGKLQQAQACFEEGLTIAEQIGSDEIATQILVALGGVMIMRGDHAQAVALAQQGLALSRKHQQHRWMISFLLNLGAVNARQGRYAEAERFFTKALGEARLISYRERIALALTNLGSVAVDQGQPAKAEKLLLEGLAVARAIGNRERMLDSLINLSHLASTQHNHEQAERYMREGLALAREIGHLERLATMLYRAGQAAFRQGRFAEARTFQEEGLAIARAAGLQLTIGLLLHVQADCALEQGYLDEAAGTFQETLALAEAGHYQDLKGEALFGLAQVLHRQGEASQAHARGLESFHLLHAIQHARAPEVKRWLETLTPAPVKREDPLR